MFSGIIETTQKIIRTVPMEQALRIEVERPTFFNDLKVGDSIAVDGVCLTLEVLDQDKLTFTLGVESLRILKWNAESILNKSVNLERSLKFGDRIHGHLVSGHIDAISIVMEKVQQGECLLFKFSLPEEVKKFIWEKGSVAIQGVSLTVNQLSENQFSVCLIPETLKRTNLGQLSLGERVNLESDYLIKGIARSSQAIEKNL